MAEHGQKPTKIEVDDECHIEVRPDGQVIIKLIPNPRKLIYTTTMKKLQETVDN